MLFFFRPYLSIRLSIVSNWIFSSRLSLHVVLLSTVSIYPSLYRVEPDLCLSLYMLFFVRPYLSIRLSIVSNRIFSSLFACCSSRSTVSIDPSCYCVVPDLFPLSLRVILILFLFFFFVLLLLSILLLLLSSCLVVELIRSAAGTSVSLCACERVTSDF